MKVEAEVLSAAIAQAMNGVGKKGLHALNTAITLLDDEGKLSLLTTSGIATLKIATSIPTNGFKSCSVDNTIFVNLISRLSGEIELSIEDNRNLFIKGKGEYKIPLIFDYNGNIALIQNIRRLEEGLTEINISELTRAISVCKNACPEDLNVPIYYNIYFGEDVIATNDEKLIFVPNVTKFKGLLSVHNLGTVVSVFKGDVSYKVDGKTLIMQDGNAVLETVMEDASEFPAHVTEALSLDNSLEVEYDQIMDVIEKGKLFISPFDRNVINIDIKEEGIVLRSSNNDFIEEVVYTSPNQVKPIDGLRVNLLDLHSILVSCNNGPVTISCTEDGPFIVKQNEYKGLVSLYD